MQQYVAWMLDQGVPTLATAALIIDTFHLCILVPKQRHKKNALVYQVACISVSVFCVYFYFIDSDKLLYQQQQWGGGRTKSVRELNESKPFIVATTLPANTTQSFINRCSANFEQLFLQFQWEPLVSAGGNLVSTNGTNTTKPGFEPRIWFDPVLLSPNIDIELCVVLSCMYARLCATLGLIFHRLVAKPTAVQLILCTLGCAAVGCSWAALSTLQPVVESLSTFVFVFALLVVLAWCIKLQMSVSTHIYSSARLRAFCLHACILICIWTLVFQAYAFNDVYLAQKSSFDYQLAASNQQITNMLFGQLPHEDLRDVYCSPNFDAQWDVGSLPYFDKGTGGSQRQFGLFVNLAANRVVLSNHRYAVASQTLYLVRWTVIVVAAAAQFVVNLTAPSRKFWVKGIPFVHRVRSVRALVDVVINLKDLQAIDQMYFFGRTSSDSFFSENAALTELDDLGTHEPGEYENSAFLQGAGNYRSSGSREMIGFCTDGINLVDSMVHNGIVAPPPPAASPHASHRLNRMTFNNSTFSATQDLANRANGTTAARNHLQHVSRQPHTPIPPPPPPPPPLAASSFTHNNNAFAQDHRSDHAFQTYATSSHDNRYLGEPTTPQYSNHHQGIDYPEGSPAHHHSPATHWPLSPEAHSGLSHVWDPEPLELPDDSFHRHQPQHMSHQSYDLAQHPYMLKRQSLGN